MNITTIIRNVAESLPIESVNDLPMIRQALNDSVDAAVKDGQLTEARANSWSQDRAVSRVQYMMRQGRQLTPEQAVRAIKAQCAARGVSVDILAY